MSKNSCVVLTFTKTCRFLLLLLLLFLILSSSSVSAADFTWPTSLAQLNNNGASGSATTLENLNIQDPDNFILDLNIFPSESHSLIIRHSFIYNFLSSSDELPLHSAFLRFQNCTIHFARPRARTVILRKKSSIEFINCTFLPEQETNRGGGLALLVDSIESHTDTKILVTRCVFQFNRTTQFDYADQRHFNPDIMIQATVKQNYFSSRGISGFGGDNKTFRLGELIVTENFLETNQNLHAAIWFCSEALDRASTSDRTPAASSAERIFHFVRFINVSANVVRQSCGTSDCITAESKKSSSRSWWIRGAIAPWSSRYHFHKLSSEHIECSSNDFFSDGLVAQGDIWRTALYYPIISLSYHSTIPIWQRAVKEEDFESGGDLDQVHTIRLVKNKIFYSSRFEINLLRNGTHFCSICASHFKNVHDLIISENDISTQQEYKMKAITIILGRLFNGAGDAKNNYRTYGNLTGKLEISNNRIHNFHTLHHFTGIQIRGDIFFGVDLINISNNFIAARLGGSTPEWPQSHIHLKPEYYTSSSEGIILDDDMNDGPQSQFFPRTNITRSVSKYGDVRFWYSVYDVKYIAISRNEVEFSGFSHMWGIIDSISYIGVGSYAIEKNLLRLRQDQPITPKLSASDAVGLSSFGYLYGVRVAEVKRNLTLLIIRQNQVYATVTIAVDAVGISLSFGDQKYEENELVVYNASQYSYDGTSIYFAVRDVVVEDNVVSLSKSAFFLKEIGTSACAFLHLADSRSFDTSKLPPSFLIIDSVTFRRNQLTVRATQCPLSGCHGVIFNFITRSTKLMGDFTVSDSQISVETGSGLAEAIALSANNRQDVAVLQSSYFSKWAFRPTSVSLQSFSLHNVTGVIHTKSNLTGFSSSAGGLVFQLSGNLSVLGDITVSNCVFTSSTESVLDAVSFALGIRLGSVTGLLTGLGVAGTLLTSENVDMYIGGKINISNSEFNVLRGGAFLVIESGFHSSSSSSSSHGGGGLHIENVQVHLPLDPDAVLRKPQLGILISDFSGSERGSQISNLRILNSTFSLESFCSSAPYSSSSTTRGSWYYLQLSNLPRLADWTTQKRYINHGALLHLDNVAVIDRIEILNVQHSVKCSVASASTRQLYLALLGVDFGFGLAGRFTPLLPSSWSVLNSSFSVSSASSASTKTVPVSLDFVTITRSEDVASTLPFKWDFTSAFNFSNSRIELPDRASSASGRLFNADPPVSYSNWLDNRNNKDDLAQASPFVITLKCVQWGETKGALTSSSSSSASSKDGDMLFRSSSAVKNSLASVPDDPAASLRVLPCGAFKPSMTTTHTGLASETPELTETQTLTRTASISPPEPPEDVGIAEAVLNALDDTSKGAAIIANIVSSNPTMMLSVARSGVLVRLAGCHLRQLELGSPAAVALHLANFTERVMALAPLKFPFTLLPTLDLGPRLGAAYRGAVASFIAVFVLLFLIAWYVGSIQRSRWRQHLTSLESSSMSQAFLATGESSSMTAAARALADDSSSFEHAPFDKLLIKPLVILCAFWCETAGSLAAAAPNGGHDGALGALPVALLGCFSIFVGHVVFKFVSELRPGSASSNSSSSSSSSSATAAASSSSSPRSPYSSRQQQQQQQQRNNRDPRNNSSRNNNSNQHSLSYNNNNNGNRNSSRDNHRPDSRNNNNNNNNNSNNNNSSRDRPIPLHHTEPSDLFFPRGATKKYHEVTRTILRSVVGRLGCVGFAAWNNRYINLSKNMILPGPGIWTQFAMLFNTYQGPAKELTNAERKRQERRRRQSSASSSGGRSSSSPSSSSSPRSSGSAAAGGGEVGTKYRQSLFELFSASVQSRTALPMSPSTSTSAYRYDVSRRRRLQPVWIFMTLVLTLIVTTIGGAGTAVPQSCGAGFIAAFIFTLINAALFCWLRPYVIPLRSYATCTIELLSCLGGAILATVIASSESAFEGGSRPHEFQGAITAGQYLCLIPGTIICVVIACFSVCRRACLILGKVKIVPVSDVRASIRAELDQIEELLILPFLQTSSATSSTANSSASSPSSSFSPYSDRCDRRKRSSSESRSGAGRSRRLSL